MRRLYAPDPPARRPAPTSRCAPSCCKTPFGHAAHVRDCPCHAQDRKDHR